MSGISDMETAQRHVNQARRRTERPAEPAMALNRRARLAVRSCGETARETDMTLNKN